MALSEEDRRRIEEEEYRKAASERARRQLDAAEIGAPPMVPPVVRSESPSVSDETPASKNKENANLQTGFGAGLVGSGVAGLFVFPPIGVTVLALGLTNLIWANERKKRNK